MRIKTVVDMAVKAVRTMKPRTRSQKHSTNKPVGPIVAVRSTVIGGIVEVSVRANGSHPDIYANGNLRRRHGCAAKKGSCENCERKHVYFEHRSSTILQEFQPGLLSAIIILKDRQRCFPPPFFPAWPTHFMLAAVAAVLAVSIAVPVFAAKPDAS
jgi:hypothetical protein